MLNGIIPQVRELVCGRCGFRMVQRMNDYGRFDKINECPGCKAEGQMGTLRIYTHVPK